MHFILPIPGRRGIAHIPPERALGLAVELVTAAVLESLLNPGNVSGGAVEEGASAVFDDETAAEEEQV